MCVCVRIVEVRWGLGCCYGRALGKLQDVHLAAGHRAHYHSRTWSHQRAEERANILLKCHSQQACECSPANAYTKGRPRAHTHTSTWVPTHKASIAPQRTWLLAIASSFALDLFRSAREMLQTATWYSETP